MAAIFGNVIRISFSWDVSMCGGREANVVLCSCVCVLECVSSFMYSLNDLCYVCTPVSVV